MVGGAVRSISQKVSRAAEAATNAAGAAGGAAVNGVTGAVTGAVSGIQRGIGSQSAFVPAAALTLGVVGVTGLVEWPIVLAVGGGALVLQQVNRKQATKGTTPAKAATPAKATPAKTAPAKSSDAAQSAPRKTRSTTSAKKAPRKAARSGATARR